MHARTTVTMADVARRAGVSTSTVSRVLAGTRPTDADNRARVEQAAAELGYRINLVGQALRKRRTATIGLVVPDLENPFFAALSSHLSRMFEGSGIDVLTFTSNNMLDIELRGVHSFIGRQVDALVLIPVHEKDSRGAVALAARACLTIQLDRRVPERDVHFVGCDNRSGIRLIADHVRADVDVARQPVVYVGAERASSTGHERLDGFRRAFRDLGTLSTYEGDFSFGWGERAAELILADGFRAATVVTAADVIALGVMARLQARGLRIPDDFRVIGFDGIGVTHLAHPSLTTVVQPVAEIGRTILDLIGADDTNGRPAVVRLRPALVEGGSSPFS